MNRTPLISVLMTFYNESENFIHASVKSILNQTYKNIELICVLDNPQNKEIKKVLEKYAQSNEAITLLQNQKNIGLASSLNKAISKAKGEYFARMDADDVAKNTRIEKQLQFLKINKKIDLVGSNAFIINNKGEVKGSYSKPLTNNQIRFFLRYGFGPCVIHPSWMGKASLFEKISSYRNISSAQDYDFLLRAFIVGASFANIKENLLYYRINDNAISQKKAYEQYVNAKEIRKEFIYAIKNKKQVFREWENPVIIESEKESYQKTVTYLNVLREQLRKRSVKVVFLTIKIFFMDKRPIMYRVKDSLISKLILPFVK